jgi:ferredoxin
MLQAYHRAGGKHPLLLVHDGDHGAGLIDAAARFGDGLPAHVLPLSVNEVTQVGLEAIAAAFAGGVAAVSLLTRAKPRHDTAGLAATVAIAETLAAGLGFGAGLVRVLAADDPDEMVRELATAPLGRVPSAPSWFEPLGGKRDVLRLALRELHRVAPAPIDTIALPKGAVFGRVNVSISGCTLCLACVAACPTSALSDNAEKPQLKFDESLCVQCGLCQATCPEKVITLEPRLSFASFEAPAVVIKEEEPFCCEKCAKPFGVKSTIERIIGKLQGQHWMFTGEHAKRLELLKMCDDCRIETVTNQGFDPYAAGKRAPARTTEDYLKERDDAARAAAMTAKIERGEA